MGDERGPSSTAGQLAGKVALITGAASGQGRATAQLFADHGAAIVAVDVSRDGVHETVERIEKDGGRATALPADVSRRRDCNSMIAAAVETYGRLDVLSNNAPIHMSGRLVDTTEEMWDTTIATNLSAIFWACRAAIPNMLAVDGGAIVNTSSTLGRQSSGGHAAYGAAQAGLIALTRQIAAEHRPRVRANVIAPGSIDTPRFRKVTDDTDHTDDVARFALFLASDASAYITGAVIPCDGGRAAFR